MVTKNKARIEKYQPIELRELKDAYEIIYKLLSHKIESSAKYSSLFKVK